MARRKRIDHEGSWHHLMNRGAQRQAIFLDDGDRHHFTTILSKMEEKFGIEIHAYCLMGNHYHILVRSQHERLSESMKWLGLRYSGHFNWKHGRDGSPFRGRFHSVPVSSDEHLIAAARYIHRNPIDLGVPSLVGYRWSSLARYVGVSKRPGWIHTESVLGLSGGCSGYESYVVDDNVDADLLVEHDGQPSTSAIRLQLDPEGDLDRLGELSERIELRLQQMDPGGEPKQQLVRQLLLYLAIDVGRVSTADVADHLGFASRGSVRAALSRARSGMASDPLATQVAQDLAGASWVVR